MELNRIKLLEKAELLKKLRQNGFTNVVDILQDKEIDGGKFVDLNEFGLFKWKLSQPEKKCLLDCIKEIKANPNRLFSNEQPKLPRNNSLRRSSSFSQNENSSNAFKGKLANLLGASAASTGSALTLPNTNNRTFNKVDKNADNNVTRIKPLPPLPNSSRENESVTNQKPIQIGIKKAPLPLPEKSNNKKVGLGESKNFKIISSLRSDIPTEMYMDMQPPITTKIASEDDGYLTPQEVSVPATIFRNSRMLPAKNNFNKNNNSKKVQLPLPPPPPPPPLIPNIINKNVNALKKNIFKDHRSLSSPQRNLPNTNNREGEEDTYEVPPKIEKTINVHRTINFPKSSSKGNQNDGNISYLYGKPKGPTGSHSVINTSKLFVEIVTDQAEEESSYEIVPNHENMLLKQINNTKSFVQTPRYNELDDTYENPPLVNGSKIIHNKTETNKSTNINESTLQVDALNTNKPTTNKEFENMPITEKDTQKPVLTKLFNNFFRGKISKNVYENHSIIPSETRVSVNMPVKNRPLPETPRPLPEPPVETTGFKIEPNAAHNLFSKPFPPPREITPISDEGYIKLVDNSNTPKESPSLFVSKQNGDKFEKEHIHDIGIIETARKENKSQSFIQRRPNVNVSFVKDAVTDATYESNDRSDEEITDYENCKNHSVQTPQISIQDHLASLLAKQLRERNLINTEKTQSTSADDDTEFEDEDNEQPFYDNTSIPNTHFPTIQKKIDLFPNQSISKNILPPYNVSNVDNGSDDDDFNEQVYTNTPTPTRNTSGQMKNNLRPNLFLQKTNSSTHNTYRVDMESDQDQPVYGNSPSPTPSRKTSTQRNNLSPNPFTPSHDIDLDDDNLSYGNTPKANINTPNRIKHISHSNQLSIASKTLSSISINSTVKDATSEDENYSYDIVEETIPIYKRPLPDIPKISVFNAFKNSIPLNPRSPIKDTNISTPPSSGDENVCDENITYGNIDESSPVFKRPLPISSIKTPNNQFKKPDKTPLPKPPKPLKYEHFMINEHKQRKITVNGSEEDEDHSNSIFNINDEPYYRYTDRKGAKLLLRNLEDGAFLFRPSQSHFLVLTVKHQGKFYNLGIERSSNNKIRLNSDGDSIAPEFASLKKFVEYFESEPVTFEDNKGGIVEIYLKTVLPPFVY